jgi:hypothetical protein
MRLHKVMLPEAMSSIDNPECEHGWSVLHPQPCPECSERLGTIYFDLDGVMADFDTSAEGVLGMSSHEFQFKFGAAELWRRLTMVPDFWLNFQLMPGAWAMWCATADMPRAILTALPSSNDEDIDRQKRRWVNERLGSVKVITCQTEEKPNHCQPGDVLIDDRNINEKAWVAKGGHFIHYMTPSDTLLRLAEIRGRVPKIAA